MKRRLFGAVGTAVLLGGILAYAQGLPIKSGASSDLATVNTKKAVLVTAGQSDIQSYIASVSNAAIIAAGPAIEIESEVSRGFRISKVCIQPGSATTAAFVQWQLIRTTTVSSGGTVVTSEVTSGNNGLAKMDPADSNWSGVVRVGALTAGTSGAILDTGSAFVSATATPPAAFAYFCREYGLIDGKQPVIAAGVTNGIKLTFEGTAAGADFAAQIHFVAQ